MFQYKPKSVEQITVREFNFNFPDAIDPGWIPRRPSLAHFLNGVSLTMPYLEPYLVKTALECKKHVGDERLLEDIAGFCGQETQHFQCHRRLNQLLRTNGYEEFAELEEQMDAEWKALLEEDIEARLAYSAGFETMTNGFTRWLINKRTRLFKNANPHITSFWLMHLIEETEHKTVAFDCYMSYSGRYWTRIKGLFRGSFHVINWGRKVMLFALGKDGVLHKPATGFDLIRTVFGMLWHVGPLFLRAMLPWHDPRNETDPPWMLEWTAGYEKLPPDAPIPLLNTNEPGMPVPFASDRV